MSNDTREAVASIQHDIWAHWMKYLFSVCYVNHDGTVTIPADKAIRWKRQMNTEYAKLSDKEQESDRHQADKVLSVLSDQMSRLRAKLDAVPVAALRRQYNLDDQRTHDFQLDALDVYAWLQRQGGAMEVQEEVIT